MKNKDIKAEIFNWVKVFQSYYKNADIGMSSAAVSYYFLLSLFPIILTIGSLLPFLNLNVSEIMSYVEQVIPKDIYNRISDVIISLLTDKSSGRLSIGLIFTLWAASQGIGALQNAMTKVYQVKKVPNLLLNRLFGMLLLIASMILFVASIVFVTFGHNLFVIVNDYIDLPVNIIKIVSSLVLPLSIIGLFVLIVLLNYLLPDVRFRRLKFLLPGSIFSLLGFLVLSKAFDIYLQYFGTRISSYQIIGTAIILMVWLTIIAQILLYGAVINATYIEKATGEKPEVRQIRKWIKRKVNNEKKEF